MGSEKLRLLCEPYTWEVGFVPASHVCFSEECEEPERRAEAGFTIAEGMLGLSGFTVSFRSRG